MKPTRGFGSFFLKETTGELNSDGILGGIRPAESCRDLINISQSPPGKYCYDFQPDVSKSEMAMQLAKEAEEAQEEERKIARQGMLS